jgi:formyl-CoA transferase
VFDAAGVPAGPVKKITEMPDDPQVQANELVVELDHPVAKTVSMVGPLFKMHGTPTAPQSAPPTLGQHNDEILSELGYDRAGIDSLRHAGVIS